VGRRLYKDRRDPTAQALAALDLKLGIVEGFWTQRAAEQAHVARRPGARCPGTPPHLKKRKVIPRT
jgi:hypothetical protein